MMEGTMQLNCRDDDADTIASELRPGVPIELIRAIYGRAPGNEIASGKFASRESSAALAANTFGLFLARPFDLPPLPGCEAWGWPASAVDLEAIVRFPWSGGRHPCLDALIETSGAVIGVESKRYEPFRTKPADPTTAAQAEEPAQRAGRAKPHPLSPAPLFGSNNAWGSVLSPLRGHTWTEPGLRQVCASDPGHPRNRARKARAAAALNPPNGSH
jgi:hypothetical protein